MSGLQFTPEPYYDLGRPYEVRAEVERKGRAAIALIGDSWFEFYRRHPDPLYAGPYEEDARCLDAINLGIGGTTYREWLEFVRPLCLKLCPDKIAVNLGFNDVHYGRKPEEIAAEAQKLLDIIRIDRPESSVYLLAVCPALSSLEYRPIEKCLNAMIRDLTSRNKRTTYIPCDELFYSGAELRTDFRSLFTPDGYHLSAKGYRLWAPALWNALGIRRLT